MLHCLNAGSIYAKLCCAVLRCAALRWAALTSPRTARPRGFATASTPFTPPLLASFGKASSTDARIPVPAADSRRQTADGRQQTAGSRQQTIDNRRVRTVHTWRQPVSYQ
jgi:hypothetical protein